MLPAGKGLLTFSSMDEALAEIEAINADYKGRCRAARLRLAVTANLRPADAGIGEARLRHFFRPIDITQIDDDGFGERCFQLLQVEGAEGVPFGEDDQDISAARRLVGPLAIGDGGG